MLGSRLLFNYSGCGSYSQATPGLLNAYNCEFKQKSDYSVLYLLGLEDQFSATGNITCASRYI